MDGNRELELLFLRIDGGQYGKEMRNYRVRCNHSAGKHS